MYLKCLSQLVDGVALLAEGVDRNGNLMVVNEKVAESPSSRRAWIEMSLTAPKLHISLVALLAEGVDRNDFGFIQMALDECRPPRGGRG